MRVEMDYQDANGETLTASQQIPLYPSAIQLGVKTDGWMMKQDDLRLKFVALDTDGKPAKGRKVSVAVYSRAPKSVVSGTSVSVRVDLGGRRIIKKQTTFSDLPSSFPYSPHTTHTH